MPLAPRTATGTCSRSSSRDLTPRRKHAAWATSDSPATVVAASAIVALTTVPDELGDPPAERREQLSLFCELSELRESRRFLASVRFVRSCAKL